MTKTRAAIVAAAALAVTGSVAVGVLTAGAGVSAAPALPAASVRAEVAAAPAVVSLPAAPVRKAAATAPAKVVTVKAVTKAAAPKPAPVKAHAKSAPSPVAATKPAAKPMTAPEPAPAPAAKTGDDYPWRTSAGTANDTWGFTQRQCVSFAAFRLAQHGNAISTGQGWGSALTWDDTARSRGVTVSTTPRVGAVAQWNAGESSTVAGGGRFTAGSYGHVGYVAAVYADGTALVEQYNLGGDRSYTALRMTAPRYLVF